MLICSQEYQNIRYPWVTSVLARSMQSTSHSRSGPVPRKGINMTQYARTQILSAFAAIICAFITIGVSVAPAVAPDVAIIA